MVAALVAGCGVALMAPGASAAVAHAGGSAPVILVPRDSALVVGKSVRVRVIARRDFQAIVGRRDVTGRFGGARVGVCGVLCFAAVVISVSVLTGSWCAPGGVASAGMWLLRSSPGNAPGEHFMSEFSARLDQVWL